MKSYFDPVESVFDRLGKFRAISTAFLSFSVLLGPSWESFETSYVPAPFYGRRLVVLRLADDDSDTPGAKNPYSLFFVKKSGKIRKIVFLDSWDLNKNFKLLDFFNFFIIASISYINDHFRAPSPSKTLKITTARSKSAGVLT